MNQPAFDHLAENYDHTFTHTEIGRWLRGRIHARLNTHFFPGCHVLELGCGTGEDTLHLASQGIHVTATDVSPKMLEITRHKTHGNSFVRVVELDLRDLTQDRLLESNIFDGAFSNFGPLNVLNDWKPLASWLALKVKPGGIVGLGVMGPFCIWEIMWHGMHLDFKTGMRRLKGHATFQPDETAAPIEVFYPTIEQLEADFSAWFSRVHVESIGLFLPPSDVYGVIEKRPRLMKILMNLERRFAKNRSLARFADHYWIEFERKN
jgi:SAM-dependent methyltransferase